MEKLTGKKVVMIIAEKDFRDEELLEPRKILEEKGASVTVASTTLRPTTGMFGAKAKPDILVSEAKVDDYDAIIFVGGAGASQYWNDSTAHSIARETVQKDKILCAICIAPVTLANAGVLSGKKTTVWASERGKLEAKGASYTGSPVEVAGKIITGSGPEAAQEFGREIARALAPSG
jgi:protease I